jgi:hypothetical protein
VTAIVETSHVFGVKYTYILVVYLARQSRKVAAAEGDGYSSAAIEDSLD